MSIGPLKRRSSWPSSFVTGLIGWNGFFIILAIILGDILSAGEIFILATSAAVVQVLILRLLFFVFRIDRSLLAGGVFGGITGLLAAIVEMRFFTHLFDPHPIIWAINALYIGIAVGLFLSYFYRDDRKIENEESNAGRQVDYGRDAHWLEPFAFGAIAYLIAFVPSSFDLAVIVLVVGAMSGVVAAGVSHFIIFTVPRGSLLPLILSIAAGAAQGALSGLLFHPFMSRLILLPMTHGAIAGSLTYLLTALRGRSLAGKEMTGSLQ
jgi:hypothetical protein